VSGPAEGASAPPWGVPVRGNRWDELGDGRPEARRRVSVVVPYYRQQAELDRTLAALARQTWPAHLLEVVVVDDGSPEPPRVPSGVVVVRQEDRGFRLAAARNLGARTATGDLLCFLDADTAPEPGYVEALVRLPSLSPEVVTVGRRRHADFAGVDVAAPVEVAGPETELDEPAWLSRAYRDSDDLLRADDRSYRHVIGAVTACTRWLLDEVGGWDESFRAYGGEDWEWAHRAWAAGAVLAHVPDAVAWHDGPDWAGRDGDDEARQRRQNDETLTLARLVPVEGSRPRALRTGAVDVVVELGEEPAGAAAVLAVDGVLEALPGALVVVRDEVARLLGGDDRVVAAGPAPAAPAARVRVVLPRAVRVRDGGALVDAVAQVGVDDLGTVVLVDAGGAEVARVTARRAALRSRRWGRDDLFRTERRTAPGLEVVEGEPSLAAWFGGWDRPSP
jgi:GT2 family glycosyltransferase